MIFEMFDDSIKWRAKPKKKNKRSYGRRTKQKNTTHTKGSEQTNSPHFGNQEIAATTRAHTSNAFADPVPHTVRYGMGRPDVLCTDASVCFRLYRELYVGDEW